MIKVAALLMAAGNARRMGGPNKLLMQFQDQPMIDFAIHAIARAKFAARVLVTGRDHLEIENRSIGFELIHNPDFKTGFGSSLGVGFSAFLERPDIDGALVMLADMPLITSNDLDSLIVAFNATNRRAIIRASHRNQPGNPVIIPKVLFAAMAGLKGEQSGQAILRTSGLKIKLVDVGEAALADIDTPEALAGLQGAAL